MFCHCASQESLCDMLTMTILNLQWRGDGVNEWMKMYLWYIKNPQKIVPVHSWKPVSVWFLKHNSFQTKLQVWTRKTRLISDREMCSRACVLFVFYSTYHMICICDISSEESCKKERLFSLWSTWDGNDLSLGMAAFYLMVWSVTHSHC